MGSWTRIVFVLCPQCRRVMRQESELAASPTSTTRLGSEVCDRCRPARHALRMARARLDRAVKFTAEE